MAKRINNGVIPIELTAKETMFVIEYTKDFSPRRAAEASGHSPDSGYDIANRDTVQKAVQWVLNQRLESSHIDAEWVLMEAVDNHMIARQRGNISASNTALNLIMKHTLVDAVASDKLNLNVHADKDVMEKLNRGRERVRVRDKPDDEVSFF